MSLISDDKELMIISGANHTDFLMISHNRPILSKAGTLPLRKV